MRAFILALSLQILAYSTICARAEGVDESVMIRSYSLVPIAATSGLRDESITENLGFGASLATLESDFDNDGTRDLVVSYPKAGVVVMLLLNPHSIGISWHSLSVIGDDISSPGGFGSAVAELFYFKTPSNTYIAITHVFDNVVYVFSLDASDRSKDTVVQTLNGTTLVSLLLANTSPTLLSESSTYYFGQSLLAVPGFILAVGIPDLPFRGGGCISFYSATSTDRFTALSTVDTTPVMLCRDDVLGKNVTASKKDGDVVGNASQFGYAMVLLFSDGTDGRGRAPAPRIAVGAPAAANHTGEVWFLDLNFSTSSFDAIHDDRGGFLVTASAAVRLDLSLLHPYQRPRTGARFGSSLAVLSPEASHSRRRPSSTLLPYWIDLAVGAPNDGAVSGGKGSGAITILTVDAWTGTVQKGWKISEMDYHDGGGATYDLWRSGDLFGQSIACLGNRTGSAILSLVVGSPGFSLVPGEDETRGGAFVELLLNPTSIPSLHPTSPSLQPSSHAPTVMATWPPAAAVPPPTRLPSISPSEEDESTNGPSAIPTSTPTLTPVHSPSLQWASIEATTSKPTPLASVTDMSSLHEEEDSVFSAVTIRVILGLVLAVIVLSALHSGVRAISKSAQGTWTDDEDLAAVRQQQEQQNHRRQVSQSEQHQPLRSTHGRLGDRMERRVTSLPFREPSVNVATTPVDRSGSRIGALAVRRERVELIPTMLFSKFAKKNPKAVNAQQTCVICLCTFGKKWSEKVKIIPGCGHWFHASCLDEWMRRGSELCPLCKRNVHEAAEGELKYDGSGSVQL